MNPISNLVPMILIMLISLLQSDISNSYCLAWGSFASSESIPKNSGKTFTFSFPTTFSSSPYNILMNCFDGSETDNGASSYSTAIISKTVSNCKARIGNWASAARSLSRCLYYAIGYKS